MFRYIVKRVLLVIPTLLGAAALVFVLVPVAAHFLLGEPWSWNTLVGGGVIMLGVIIAVR